MCTALFIDFKRESVRIFNTRSWSKTVETRNPQPKCDSGTRFPFPDVTDLFVASSRVKKPVATMEDLTRSCRTARSSSYPITKRSMPPLLWRNCINAYCTRAELFDVLITVWRVLLSMDSLATPRARFGPKIQLTYIVASCD
jgi:hypothetical protein